MVQYGPVRPSVANAAKYGQVQWSIVNYDKLGQEKTMKMCFPLYQWYSDEIRQDNDKIWQNMTKYNEIRKKLTKLNKHQSNKKNKANLRTLRINTRGQK